MIGRWLSDLVVGKDRRMQARLGLCLVSMVIYGCWIAVLLAYAVPRQLMSEATAHFFVGYISVALCVFYPLVRSGLTRTWSDPGLVAPQILWASGAMIIGYAVAPVVRSVAFQTLCLIQVFGFLSLRPKVAAWTGGLTTAMLVIAWSAMTVLGLSDVDPRAEALKILASCFVLVLMTVQSRSFGLMRERAFHEKRSLAAAAKALRRITIHDGLTGLYNRAHMQERLEAEVQRALLNGHHFSVALIDLDHFKNINDTHGHPVGDEVLVNFAFQGSAVLRETDVIGRWGGEEFLVLMPETEAANQAQIAMTRLRDKLRSAQMSQGAADLRARFSCGIATWSTQDTIEQVLERADQALYRAKSNGRDRTELEPPLTPGTTVADRPESAQCDR
ncbi:GGDEF domain-containing protein [Aquabacterium sp.]|uniref:GGDEF domain-containing protein n=1 Tax=Aquabacterium sp. TaxID=1872578 RepID=UPI0019A8EC58|nr:GGDEF domain-containing protein [Aquabacterium sp.]MBC7701587.1 GGDEF domain-containing protein [Aquabacterium sp.]